MSSTKVIMTQEKIIARKQAKSDYQRKYREANSIAVTEKARNYRQANKDMFREKDKERADAYREGNREMLAEKARKYRELNKEKVADSLRKYREANRDKMNEKDRQRYAANKDKFSEKTRKYHKANKEKWNSRVRSRTKIRRSTDPFFAMTKRLRNRVWNAFRALRFSKTSKTAELLGADWITVRSHIEKQFAEGMTWENRGLWHIDHIVPLASAANHDQLHQLFHYTNMQPLWAEENMKKSNRLDYQRKPQSKKPLPQWVA